MVLIYENYNIFVFNQLIFNILIKNIIWFKLFIITIKKH